MGLPLLFDDLLVGIRGRNGELSREKKVASPSRRDFDDLTLPAHIFNVFTQNHFHSKPATKVYQRLKPRDMIL